MKEYDVIAFGTGTAMNISTITYLASGRMWGHLSRENN